MAVVGPPLGGNPFIEPIDREVVNRAAGSGTSNALVLGDVVQFDLRNSDASVNTNLIGDSNSGFSCVVTPEDGLSTLKFGIYGVVIKLINGSLDNGRGIVRLRGIVDVDVEASVAVGEGLRVQASNVLEGAADTPSASDKIVGIALATNGASEGLITCLFDGIYGFGDNGSA